MIKAVKMRVEEKDLILILVILPLVLLLFHSQEVSEQRQNEKILNVCADI